MSRRKRRVVNNPRRNRRLVNGNSNFLGGSTYRNRSNINRNAHRVRLIMERPARTACPLKRRTLIRIPLSRRLRQMRRLTSCPPMSTLVTLKTLLSTTSKKITRKGRLSIRALPSAHRAIPFRSFRATLLIRSVILIVYLRTN